MSTHNLTIENLQTECKIMAGHSTALAFRTHLDQRLKTALPTQLQRALEGPLSHYEGIVRIKQLAVKLSWGQPFDEVAFANRIALKISQALLQKFQSRQKEIYVWDNRMDYMLSYIEMRLGLSVIPDWAFPDFAALRYISPTQAALELLKQAPELLLAGPRHTLAINDFSDIVSLLPEVDVLAFIAALPKVQANSPLSVADAIRILASYMPVYGLKNLSHQPAKSVLQLMVLAAKEITLETIPTYFIAAKTLIALALLDIGKQENSLTFNSLADRLKQVDMSKLPLMWAETLQLTCVGTLETRELSLVLAKLSGQNLKPLSSLKQIYERDIEVSNMKTHSGLIISSFAGLALLLPYIARDHIEKILTPQQMRALLISVVSENRKLGAGTDEFIMSITSCKTDVIAEIDIDFPPVPETTQAYFSDEVRNKITGLSGLDSWREYLLARFTSGLSGLQTSSAAYLQTQFFEVAGRAEFNDEAIHVNLPVVPLGIVLQISGMLGDRGPIPHLQNRILTISTGEARP